MILIKNWNKFFRQFLSSVKKDKRNKESSDPYYNRVFQNCHKVLDAGKDCAENQYQTAEHRHYHGWNVSKGGRHSIEAFFYKVHVFFINLVHVDGVGNLVFLPHYLTAQNCNAHYCSRRKIIEIIPLCVFESDIQINVFGKKIISVTSIGQFLYQNIFYGFKSALAEQTVILVLFAVLINFFQSRLLRRF